MPKSPPLPDWSGRDVFVIGGGPSLTDFDFNLLRGRCAIGCNQAFRKGAEICQICAFGDNDFWEACGQELEGFGGWVATCYPVPEKTPWLARYARQDDGLAFGPTLAWNGHTGALCTNLALSLGALRVFLLGMDMDCAVGGPNSLAQYPLAEAKSGPLSEVQGGLLPSGRCTTTCIPGSSDFQRDRWQF